MTFSEAPLAILAGGYDAAFVLASNLPDSVMVAHELGNVRCVACASPTYIRRRGAPQTIADVGRHTFLQLHTPNLPEGMWTLAGRDAATGINAKPFGLAFNHESALLSAIHAGLGIGLLPAASALPGLESGELVPVLGSVALRELKAYVVFPSRKFVDAKIRAWTDFLRKRLPAALAAECAELSGLLSAQQQLGSAALFSRKWIGRPENISAKEHWPQRVQS